MIDLIKKRIEQKKSITDKYEKHCYIVEFYSKEFERYRHLPISLLEIGVDSGCSIELWCEYFYHPKSKIIGIDINLQRMREHYQISRAKYFEMNAYTRQAVESLPMFDVMIDDGPHDLQSQTFFVQNYLERLSPGGIAIVEDVPTVGVANALVGCLPDEWKQKSEILDLQEKRGNAPNDDILVVIRN